MSEGTWRTQHTVSYQQQASDTPDDRLLRISDLIIFDFTNKNLSSTCMCGSSLNRTTHPFLGFICIIRNPQWSFACINLLHHNFTSNNNFSVTVMAGLVESRLDSGLDVFAHWNYQKNTQECYLLKTSRPILCSVDCTSLYKFVNETNLVHNLFLVYFINFISNLYIFRTSPGSSWGGTTVFIWHLVPVILCGSLSAMQDPEG
jgi:hypothetical protein